MMISYYIKLVCFIFYYCYIYIYIYYIILSLYYITWHYINLYDIVLCYIISYHIISYHHSISYYCISYYTVLCYIMVSFVILCFTISYYITYKPIHTFFFGMYHICIRERLFSRSLSFRHCCKMDRWIQPENMRLTWTIVSSQPKWTQTTLCWTLLG